MSVVEVVAVVLWVGVTLYAVFGGADFGVGFWDLVAGGAERGTGPRALIDRAIGPVWEANHTWLIFDLVVLWTAFPLAFSSIMTTLFVPLTLAALGIVLRGASFAFRRVATGERERRALGAAFAISSVVTPFFMGAVVGAIASGRVVAGDRGDLFASWVTPISFVIGALFVATCAYLSATFLVADARRAGDAALVGYFGRRAVAAGIAAGALALAGILVLREEAALLYDGLTGEGVPLVALSAVCGLAALGLLRRGSRRAVRALAAGAVTAVVWGWGVAQWPYLLPETLTLDQAAAPSATLVALLIVFGAAAVVVVPALLLLLRLHQRSLLDEEGA